MLSFVISFLMLPLSIWGSSDESLKKDIHAAMSTKLKQIFSEAPESDVRIEFRLEEGVVQIVAIEGANQRIEKRINRLDGKLLDRTFGSSDLFIVQIRASAH